MLSLVFLENVCISFLVSSYLFFNFSTIMMFPKKTVDKKEKLEVGLQTSNSGAHGFALYLLT